jgi:hypothetical protein
MLTLRHALVVAAQLRPTRFIARIVYENKAATIEARALLAAQPDRDKKRANVRYRGILAGGQERMSQTSIQGGKSK